MRLTLSAWGYWLRLTAMTLASRAVAVPRHSLDACSSSRRSTTMMHPRWPANQARTQTLARPVRVTDRSGPGFALAAKRRHEVISDGRSCQPREEFPRRLETARGARAGP